MTARMAAAGYALLFCDGTGCDATFTRRYVAVRVTRVAATKAGWNVADRDQRTDFCPAHEGNR